MPADRRTPKTQPRIFCSLDCNREYHRHSVGYPGDGDEDYCENCGKIIEDGVDIPE